MSLLHRLLGKTPPTGETTLMPGVISSPGDAKPGKRERVAHRELLYAVVRDSMVKAEILSSAYRFKVLSLDRRGRQFLVMVDLQSAEAGRDFAQLAGVEASIVKGAKARHDLLVQGVYWRQKS